MALLCGASTGCALLPLAAVNLATAGAQGAVALTLGPLDAMKERSVADRCLVYADRGIAVSESLETVIPFDEGEMKTFEPAFWRPEFSRDGYPDVERTRNSTEVTLAIGTRSAFLVPPPGAIRTRIPYELVQDVELRTDASADQPSSLIVRSCNGRFDIVTFWQKLPDRKNPDATVAAAAQLKERVTAFRASAEK